MASGSASHALAEAPNTLAIPFLPKQAPAPQRDGLLHKSSNFCGSRTQPGWRECGLSSVLGRRWRICIYMLASFGLEHRAHLLKLLERRAFDPRELQVEAVQGLGQGSC